MTFMYMFFHSLFYHIVSPHRGRGIIPKEIKLDLKLLHFFDFNKDGFIDIYIDKAGLDIIKLNDGKGSFSKTIQTSINAMKGFIYFADVDNDGDIDVIQEGRGSSNIIWENNGDAIFFADNKDAIPEYRYEPWATYARSISAVRATQTNVSNGVVFVDVNNDGKLDIIKDVYFQAYGYGWSNSGWRYFVKAATYKSFVFIKTDNGYKTHTVIDEGSSLPERLYQDLNNDGVVDILYPSRGKVRLSNSSGNWNLVSLPMATNAKNLKFSDFNNDGNIDILLLNKVYVNDGTGHIILEDTLDFSTDKDNINIADLNGDGFSDIYVSNAGNDDIWLNNGRGSFELSSEHPDVEVEGNYLGLVDINGDGMTDIVPFKSENNIYINQLKPTLIKSITDSFGNIIEIDYKNLTDENIYSKHISKKKEIIIYCKYGANCPRQFEELTKINIYNSSLVVASLISDNGIDGLNKISYAYENLAYDFKRGLLGFKKIVTTDKKLGRVNETIYYQDFPLTGRIKETTTFINDESSSFSNINLQASIINKQPTPLSMSHATETINGITTNNRSNYSSIRNSINTKYIPKRYSIELESKNKYDTVSNQSTNISYKYDNYGNTLQMRTTTKGADGKRYTNLITSTYKNNKATWTLGRLKNTSVTHEGEGEAITRKSAFTYNAKGSIETETIEPGNNLSLTTSYEYDSFGNLIRKSISSPSLPNSRVTEYEYSANGKYLLKTTNPLGHSNRANNKYNALGQLIESTNANGLSTKVEYDAWGKKTKVTNVDGTTTTYNYAFDSSVDGAKYAITVKSTGSPATTTYYDSFDRTLRVKSKRFDGKEVFVDTIYNEKSEVYRKSLPHTADETPQYMTYTYDEYGRMVQTQKPGPNGATITQSVEYNGLSSTVTDAKGHQKTTTKNVLGKTVKVEETDTVLEYKYDSIGNLVKTIPNGNQAMAIEMHYDILGNKTVMKDPDMGSWSYTYNALGQLIRQTDAKGQTMSIEYDKLGRKTKETTTDGVSSWVYDTASHGLGKLASESNGKISKKYSYDAFGRVSFVKSRVENKNFTQSYSYNAQGKLAKTTQPNGFELLNSYNEQGYLESIKSPAQQIQDFDRDHFEQLLEKMMANGLDYYKKSLEYTDKAKRLRSKANYYAAIAKRYGNYKKRYHDYAKRLRVYAKRYEYYGKRYASYSQRYRSYANYYYTLANRYRHYWWGRWVSSWFNRIGNRYSYYADRYAYYSRYYLNRAKHYEYWANRYDYYGSYFGRVEGYYLKRSKQLYAEANALQVKAKEFKRLSKQTSQQNENQVTQAYKEILADANYVYHYKVLAQNSLGKVTKYLSGNGLVTEDIYNETGIMTDAKTGYTFDDGVRNLHYEYDANYNVTSREDKKLKITQTFGYDQLDRINWTTATSNTIGFESNNYAYDVYGNLIHKDGKELTYGKGNHQVTTLDNGTAYKYDANGNMVKNGQSTITFNAHNKVVDLRENGTHIHFAYDMNQNRYKKSEGLKDTYYIGKTYEYQTHTNGSETHKYMIYANGKVVTVHTEATEIQSSGEKLTIYETRYLHYDSLGSVDAITNQQGTVVQRTAYKPFGEQIELTKAKKSITNRGYTGHEHIEGTKFIHMNARLYDPTIGRFLSADTFIQDPYDAQSYNRYSYVRNNPLRYIDPTGHIYAGTLISISGGGSFGGGFGGGSGGNTFIRPPVQMPFGGAGSLSTAYITPVSGFATSASQSTGTTTSQMSFATQYASNTLLGRIYAEQFATYATDGFNSTRNAIIGGTSSEITGGKFSNGADSVAFEYMFNDALHDFSDFVAGFGDTISFGLTSKLRDLVWGEDGYYLNDDSVFYTTGEVTGIATSTVMGGSGLWSAGLNGGAKSVFWSGPGTQIRAMQMGKSLEMTPIGSVLNRFGDKVPYWIWKRASATYANNATGTALKVGIQEGNIWKTIERPILQNNNVGIKIIP